MRLAGSPGKKGHGWIDMDGGTVVFIGWAKKTKAVNWEFPFNCFCFFGPRGMKHRAIESPPAFYRASFLSRPLPKNENKRAREMDKRAAGKLSGRISRYNLSISLTLHAFYERGYGYSFVICIGWCCFVGSGLRRGRRLEVEMGNKF